MRQRADSDMIQGFVEEARDYLPVIRQNLDLYLRDPSRTGELREAFRLVHTIKGASSMVGLNELSEVARGLEVVLENTIETGGELTPEIALSSLAIQQRIEECLDALSPIPTAETHLPAPDLRFGPGERARPSVEYLESIESAILAPDAEPRVQPLSYDDQTHRANQPSALGDQTLLPAISKDDATDGVSPELVEAFVLEAEEHLGLISRALTNFVKDPSRTEQLQSVRRSAHTLKGAAALVGFPEITRLSHRMEDLLDLLYDGFPLTSETTELLFASTDALDDLTRGDVDESRRHEIERIYAHYEILVGGRGESTSDEASAQALEEPRLQAEHLDAPVGLTPASPIQPIQPTSHPSGATPAETVRVPIERVDELVKLVSEVVISRSTFEQDLGEMSRFVSELRLSVERLRRVSRKMETEYEVRALATGATPDVGDASLVADHGQASTKPRRITDARSSEVSAATHGFDELEFDRYTEFHLLVRELSESWSDLGTLSSGLDGVLADFQGFLSRQSRLTSEVEDKLMRLRMVPFATLATRLHRTVRVTAKDQNKMVDLVLDGEDVELDKSVLEDIAEPLLHLLRNAVDHGVESPADRTVASKAERGEIRLGVFHEGTQIVFRISDDGRGLDPEALRSTAARIGILTEEVAAELSSEKLAELIFHPGFTTNPEVNVVSGRGVGLDIVKATVGKLKGTVVVESTHGSSTVFTIRLPMTLAIDRVLLVRARETVAVPLAAITRILRVEAGQIENLGNERVLRLDGIVYPVLHLAELLDLGLVREEPQEGQPLLIVKAGGDSVAMVVDEIIEGREIVIKTLGEHLRQIKGISGATLLGDGSVVLILNPSDFGKTISSSVDDEITVARIIPSRRPLEVLIVDDSLSVRSVLSKLVRSAGWTAATAMDGVEALEVIQHADQGPDVILLDIEMPRMDGYELTAALRAQESTRSLPIVMLTSRAGDKHRRKAFALGATDYLVKPYQDEQLLEVVKRVTDAASMVKA